ncbi:ATP/GTP-binding protein [Helicobacter sp. MIT 14-3879]|uniref:AAA family ATPase n=1 Tax=Helicobacter sp. MIT 14-3879 TaxID=2040649 RepID=UPI000E1EB5A3|nr:ATP-binding protein [Helicobacter sp. MIT 14-3879]RDU61498.1 ATP-binding protein [Helicobacter sp. MIT 14-3879]
MLRKFRIAGLYSFGDTLQEVSFISKPKSKLMNTKYEFNFNLDQANRPMKSAIFFGQNATGKTNLFLGMKSLLNIIKYGLSSTKRRFILNNAFNKNSQIVTLELELSDNNKDIFKYSIAFDKESIKKEIFKKNDKIIFNFNEEKASFNIKELDEKTLQDFFSRKLSDNILYTIKDFTEVNRFINLAKNINFYGSKTYSKSHSLDCEKSKRDYFVENKKNILTIFQLIDSSVDDFNFEELEKDGEKKYRIVFIRNQKKYSCQEESDGLKKIFILAGSLCEMAKSDKIIVIDELDSSISTRALIKIFNEIVNSEENKNGQLIVSSHNVLLFDVSFLNSQQIFLIQKNEKLETIIKSYYEYDIRSEKKKSYIDYLKGYYDE